MRYEQRSALLTVIKQLLINVILPTVLPFRTVYREFNGPISKVLNNLSLSLKETVKISLLGEKVVV